MTFSTPIASPPLNSGVQIMEREADSAAGVAVDTRSGLGVVAAQDVGPFRGTGPRGCPRASGACRRGVA
jgi:hypothetical protein